MQLFLLPHFQKLLHSDWNKQKRCIFRKTFNEKVHIYIFFDRKCSQLSVQKYLFVFLNGSWVTTKKVIRAIVVALPASDGKQRR